MEEDFNLKQAQVLLKKANELKKSEVVQKLEDVVQDLQQGKMDAEQVLEKLGALQNQLVNTKVRANEDSLKLGLGVDGNLADLAIIVGGNADGAPTEASVRSAERRFDPSCSEPSRPSRRTSRYRRW